MPPKRKIKKTKAAPADTPPAPKPSPGGPARTSTTAKRRNSLLHQGAAAAARSSRLQPSEPLHMTTRGAAKASNNSSSTPPSITDSSRRSSLAALSHSGLAGGHSDLEPSRPVSAEPASSPEPLPVTEAQSPKVLSGPASDASSTAEKRRRRASGGSTGSSKTLSAHPNGVAVRSDSDLSEQQPRRKKRRTTATPAEPTEGPPDLTDGSSAPNSPEQMLEGNSTQDLQHVFPTTNGDAPAKSTRRLPGRRRQPHSDVNVETDLRRQLNLKMNYRTLAKIQKSMLEELSGRATGNLHNNPEYYKQCPEYAPLMTSLEQHRQQRLNQVEAERRLKLEQLERIRVAQEHIENQQYINRFQDLQEDLLLQCFHRAKQIERHMKAEDGAATEDEENVVQPTYAEFPTITPDDRLGSNYASRSRAYVETERVLDEELDRTHLKEQREAFMAKNADLDDSIENMPGGFGRFIGPDRDEAIRNFNVNSMIDAAVVLERSPPQPAPPKLIPNENADALLMLASLSAERPRETFTQAVLQEQQPTRPNQAATPIERQEPPPLSPAQVATPVQQEDLQNLVLDVGYLPDAPSHVSWDAAKSSPIKAQREVDEARPATPPLQLDDVQMDQSPVLHKKSTPVKISSHRIMDLLTHDQEVLLPRSRESQLMARESMHSNSPARPASNSHHPAPSQNGTFQANPSAGSTETPRTPIEQRPSESDETLRRRDPLIRIRKMLDMKARAEGRVPPGESSHSSRNISAEKEKEREQKEREQRQKEDRERADRSHHSRLHLSQAPYNSHDRPEASGMEPRRPSVGGYNASPRTGSMSYTQSPHTPHSQPPPRPSGHDHGPPYTDQNRRLSGSHTSQHPGQPQPYKPNYHASGPTPTTHQSPYPSSNAPHLPSFSQSLPPKPPGPPPSAPINFRFAHYDPVPPRASYPPPAPAGYLPTSHPPPHAGPPPPQQHYAPPYPGPPVVYQGYVPPPGSFQAPPPPPPQQQQQQQAMAPYPQPLKIQQYGGQPILPANMAPPPPHSQPPMAYSGPPAYPPPAYAPHPGPQGPPHAPQYEQPQPPHHAPHDAPPHDRNADPQARPRRPYRSYHAPGTQFRTYQGPDSGRRRGG
ncbi:hypothetical protein BDV95DRAFT_624728 [Massariosphaeria phaeospora]|uniref:Uncharacterized protein n=1 Tax=Massariosphaeria phaeospora TaxID=100035 RepID=A0A7C8MH49_9PLEO|nr:hypothetical protein BDV95DRAFT_624728 [Massariosphaeria phaeospora]